MIARTGGIAYTDPAVLVDPRRGRRAVLPPPRRARLLLGALHGLPPRAARRPGASFPSSSTCSPPSAPTCSRPWACKGALATPPVFGILGTLAVFFALRRLLGRRAGAAGRAAAGRRTWCRSGSRATRCRRRSRSSCSSSGLLAFAHWEERGARRLRRAGRGRARPLAAGAHRQRAAARCRSALYLLVAARARRPALAARRCRCCRRFALLACHAARARRASGRASTCSSVADRPYWSQPAWVWLAGRGGARWPSSSLVPRAAGPRLGAAAWTRTAPRCGAAAMAAVAAARALRLLPAAARCRPGRAADGNDRRARAPAPEPARCAAAPWASTAWPPTTRSRFVRLGWFVTPLGLGLAVLGLLLVLLASGSRATCFPVLRDADLRRCFYFYKIRVWNDYFFALRRFVPVVLPLPARPRRARARAPGRARRLAPRALAAALGPRPLRRLRCATWPLAALRRLAAARCASCGDVARRFRPEDVVIFEQPRQHPPALAAAVGGARRERAGAGPLQPRPRAAAAPGRAPGAGRYRNIYFVHTYRTDLCGVFLQRVEDLRLRHLRSGSAPTAAPPRGPRVPRASTSRSRAWCRPRSCRCRRCPRWTSAARDDVQVSGFFDKEGGGDRTYRWTGRCALGLPARRRSRARRCAVTASARPAPGTARRRRSRSRSPACPWARSRRARTGRARAPRCPPRCLAGPPRAAPRRRRPGGRPTCDPAPDDARDLGVMVDRVRSMRGAVLDPGFGRRRRCAMSAAASWSSSRPTTSARTSAP